MQFSLFRLLLATTVFAALLGLARLVQFDMRGAVVAAAGVTGLVLLAPEKGLQWSARVAGFAPRRVAWATAILSLALVPAHFFVNCEMSERIALSGGALLLLTAGLSLADRNRKPAAPFVLALVGFFAHALCAH